MIKDNQKLLNQFLILIDALLIICGFITAYWLKFMASSPLIQIGFLRPKTGYYLTLPEYSKCLFFLVPGYLILYSFFHLYDPKRSHSKRYEIWNIIKANSLGILYFIAILFYLQISLKYSRWFTLYFYIINTAFSIFFRIGLRYLLKSFRKKGYNLKHIVLVGYSRAAEEYIDRILASPQWGYHIHGIVSDIKEIGATYHDVPVIAPIEKLSSLLEQNDLDEIAITLGLNDYHKLEKIVALCEKSGVHTKFIPDYNHIIPTRPYIEDVGGLPVINIRQVPLSNFVNRMIKRLVDIIGATFAILLFSIPMIIVAILVKTTSKGPLIFSQVRVGLHNKEFKMYKFRSMCEQTEASEKKAWTTKNDPRITPIGRFIRKTSIDELPQLFNVLKGEMSLIGPRPERPFFVEKFKEEVPRYMIKHQVRPGLTGWAQVNGYRGDTSIRKRIDCDLYYIENWSLGLDFKILIMTFFTGFVNKNAY